MNIIRHFMYMNESRHMNMMYVCAPGGCGSWSCCDWYTYICIHMSESCHVSEWVTGVIHGWVTSCRFGSWSHCDWKTCVCMSHVMCANEARQICGWVTLNIWMSHVKYVNESCHTFSDPDLTAIGTRIYEWVMLRVCMRHITDMN